MSFPPPNIQAVHNICNSVAWSVLFNFSVFLVQFKHSPMAMYFHNILGILILLLTYFGILWILIPTGFNLTVADSDLFMFIHGILGLCIMGLMIIQAGGGLVIKYYLRNM